MSTTDEAFEVINRTHVNEPAVIRTARTLVLLATVPWPAFAQVTDVPSTVHGDRHAVRNDLDNLVATSDQGASGSPAATRPDPQWAYGGFLDERHSAARSVLGSGRSPHGLPADREANTTTVEYRIPYHDFNAIVRLEHRIDDSRGPGGGFFRGTEIAPGIVGRTPTQNLFILGVILTFDSHFQP